MPAPKQPNTSAATNARRDPLGRVSRPVRILADPELHVRIAVLSPAEVGEILSAYLDQYPERTLPAELPQRIVIDALPSLPAAEVSRHGFCGPCVYIVSKDRQILYVGQTVNLLKRWGGHGGKREFKGATVHWIKSTQDNLRDLEAHLIRLLQPTVKCGGDFSSSKQRKDLDVEVRFSEQDPPVQMSARKRRAPVSPASRRTEPFRGFDREPEALARLIQGAREGKGATELAEELMISKQSVYNQLAKLARLSS